MRQSAQQADLSPLWKQEVHRRVAEHKGRNTLAATDQDAQMQPQPAPGSRAAQAAARVAARYAKAPSYSEMLADEARAAVRAAEAASRAALGAQAAAESVLAGLEAGLEAQSSATPAWEPQFFTATVEERQSAPAIEPSNTGAQSVAQPDPQSVVRASAQPATRRSSSPSQRPSFEIRWDADLPVREPGPAIARASRGTPIFEAPAENSWQPAADVRDALDAESFEVVEAAQPIHANLIEFPRELIATRKMRPRRAEGPYAASSEAQGQLSIFEVEPWTISTEPEAAGAAAEAGTATWVVPKWSGIELDEEPQLDEFEAQPATPAVQPARVENAELAAAADLALAPMNQRIMAALVDFSLIVAVFLAAGLVALAKATTLPSVKGIEFGSALALALIGVLYHAFFFTLATATPGMKYAHLEVCTLAGERPARAQRCTRMGAFLLSLLPVGLGVAWAIFDDQHLCWHDRLSGTYPRKG